MLNSKIQDMELQEKEDDKNEKHIGKVIREKNGRLSDRRI